MTTPTNLSLLKRFDLQNAPLRPKLHGNSWRPADAALYEAKRQERDRVAQMPSAESNSEQVMNVQ